MDIKFGDEAFDLRSSIGFLHALVQTCRLRAGRGGFLAAPVCSSFVFVSKGTTKRTASNPGGDESCPSVVAGNELMSRTLTLLWVCASLSIWWVLEQPKGSIMEMTAPFQYFIHKISTYRSHIAMKEFGAPSLKPTWLYSSTCARLAY